VEQALRRLGFARTEARGHSLWERVDTNGRAYRVILCAKPFRPVPREVLRRLARSGGMAMADLERAMGS
jgi:hypothetical protein